jgi:hypothetical protein
MCCQDRLECRGNLLQKTSFRLWRVLSSTSNSVASLATSSRDYTHRTSYPQRGERPSFLRFKWSWMLGKSKRLSSSSLNPVRRQQRSSNYLICSKGLFNLSLPLKGHLKVVDQSSRCRRQRRTVHGAYWYTKLFLYRSFLLEEFLQHLPNGNQFGTVHTEEMAVEVKHCVHAAMNIAQMAAEIKDNMKFNQTYWVCTFPPPSRGDAGA